MNTRDQIVKEFLEENEKTTVDISEILLVVNHTLNWIKKRENFAQLLIDEVSFDLTEISMIARYALEFQESNDKLLDIIKRAGEGCLNPALDLMLNGHSIEEAGFILSLGRADHALVAYLLLSSGLDVESTKEEIEAIGDNPIIFEKVTISEAVEKENKKRKENELIH